LAASDGQAHNYTLTLSMAPVTFLPGDDLAGDAGNGCADARAVDHGLHVGVLRGLDWQDAWSFESAPGELVTVTLKPDELDDGANFDLMVYDTDCNLVGSSSLGDRYAILPKSTPDAVTVLPAEKAGRYTAVVVRENGVGNYYLDVRSTDAMPTLPGADAGSGRDSSGPADAIDIATPSINQGDFPSEADDQDWYRLTIPAGETGRIALLPSPTSALGLDVYTANLVPVGSATAGPGLASVTVGEGTYFVAITPYVGGGGYLLGVTGSLR